MSYFDIHAEFVRFQRSKTRARGRRPSPSSPPPPISSSGRNASVAKASWRRVRAFDAVNYRVPGTVNPLRQPTSNACWATVTTMMVNWKNSSSTSISDAMSGIGQEWLNIFRADTGLAGSDKPRFLAAAGLQAEPPMSYSIEGWLQLLRTYGPLWVTTDEDPSAQFAIHARIMVGISGDGTPDGTSFQIVDPGTGTEYTEPLQTFIRKYEEEARDPSRPLRIQVVHWAANAQNSSTSQSLSRSYSRSYSRSITSRAFDDTLVWGARVSDAFRARVRQIAGNLGCDPNHLMAAMAFETGETFSPSVRNPRGTATGLIQFTEPTARSLGTTTAALAGMTAEAQLDYVERYFQPYRNRVGTLEDVYMVILWPRAVGQPNNYVLFADPSRYYQANRGLDRDRDGKVTKAEAAAAVQTRLQRGQQFAA